MTTKRCLFFLMILAAVFSCAFDLIFDPVLEEPTQEPVYEEPIQEPVYEEPTQEPVYEEPTQEPVYEEPTQEPVYEEPTQEPVYEEPTQEPVYEEPTQEPVYEEPTQEPVYEEPTQEPVYEEPTQEPVYEEPTQEPVYEEPTQEPVYEEPTQEPVYEEPTQEPVYEEPTQEPVYPVWNGLNEDQVLILYSIYSQMTATGQWLSGWFSEGDYSPCNWSGVSCENGNVVGLSFENAGYFSVFPNSVLQLQELKELRLIDTLVRGPLPDNLLESFPKLERLELKGNLFTGSLPRTPYMFESMLQEITISDNKEDERKYQLAYRQEYTEALNVYLDPYQYQNIDPTPGLDGELPQDWNYLWRLSKIDLSGNNLYGSVPDAFGQLYLSGLDLSNNQGDLEISQWLYETLAGIGSPEIKFDGLSLPAAEEPVVEQPTEEPVYVEPVVEQPTEEPVYVEPVVEQPTEEPVYVDPVVEQPTEVPVYVEPVVEQPTEVPVYVEPVVEQPTDVPVYVEPVVEQPTEVPVYVKPVVEQPTEVPVYVEPVVEQPTEVTVYVEPVVEQPTEVPVYVEPVVEQPTEVPVYVEPVVEQPTEVPVYIEPVVEQPTEVPVYVEPVVEQPTEVPVYVEPVVEQPTEVPVYTEPTGQPIDEPVYVEPGEQPTELPYPVIQPVEPRPTDPGVFVIVVTATPIPQWYTSTPQWYPIQPTQPNYQPVQPYYPPQPVYYPTATPYNNYYPQPYYPYPTATPYYNPNWLYPTATSAYSYPVELNNLAPTNVPQQVPTQDPASLLGFTYKLESMTENNIPMTWRYTGMSEYSINYLDASGNLYPAFAMEWTAAADVCNSTECNASVSVPDELLKQGRFSLQLRTRDSSGKTYVSDAVEMQVSMPQPTPTPMPERPKSVFLGFLEWLFSPIIRLFGGK